MLVEQQGEGECMSPRDIERVLTVPQEIKRELNYIQRTSVHPSKKFKNVFASVVCPPVWLQSTMSKRSMEEKISFVLFVL